MKRLLTLLIATPALLLALAGAPAGASGAWAVTYLDPVPPRFESGTSYTLGFWVLQHGTHPFEGSMNPVGLRLTRADGKTMEFKGVGLAEAAHYSASVVVPKGVWRVEGIQGPFQPYAVGTLTVPGALRINPLPPGQADMIAQTEQRYWGAVRPPGFEPGTATSAIPAPAASSAPVVTVTASPPPPAPAPDGGVPAYTLLLAAAGGAVATWAALGLPTARRRRRAEDEPDRAQEDTIVISG
ncbi:hypothetical protein ACU635_17810 [[Actinomadura] parvosata]|uniref:hypothetical protein n=1 Tax=[Actinomadura] parvosata TaxID=1955412 RepID=UPI00406D176D